MTLSITKLLVTLLVFWEQLEHVGTHISANSLSSQPKRYEYNSNWCKGPIDGDCNPYNCGGGCEGKYIRFYDKAYKMDRTIKSCFCQQERLCSIMGLHAFSGCKSYYQLSSIAQKFVRFWSMDRRDHKNRHSNNVRYRYSDKARHFQLINGNSRFCCRATAQKRLALQLRSTSSTFNYIPVIVLMAYYLIY
ncbi:hypothetical protein CAEBREN_10376 [Caenorhabditis brenneri]|uniref:Uncharacterized protein n=1 Tax=Caenorhabditis brenneri TaxID=135651 RepID=G0MEX1_CAEBE|nr:hypothetical protein CAEBREN_10376 [Caenorhabditis brenneri]